MIYLKTHDKSTIDEDITDVIDQLHYRYKEGNFMITAPFALFRYEREKEAEHGHWTPVDTSDKYYSYYISKEYQDNLALVVHYTDGCEHLPGGIGSTVDYIFTKTKNMYLSKSRTAKLRLGVKPDKVIREEEEEEEL